MRSTNRSPHLRALVCVVMLANYATMTAAVQAEDWPGWRGPRGDGTSSEAQLPLRWNAQGGENIAWKVEIPGKGHASPVVWGERIFLVSAIEEQETRVLLCLDRRTGERLWQQTVITSPLEAIHPLNSHASSTPAVDAERVYVAFLDRDQMVVAAYGQDGRQQWLVRPGPFSSKHGFCTCPVLFEDLVIVNGDHDGDSYLAALDRKTGSTRWKVPREHKTRSYVTPIIREADGRTQMMLSGSKCVTSYDPRTGKPWWYIDGPTEQFVASLVYHKGLVFLTGGFPDYHLLAIRPDGSGNVSESHIVWRHTKGAAYVPSPIASGDYFLVVSDGGVGSCFDCLSGERVWMERLGAHYSASPITAAGLVYFVADDGVAKVIRPGPSLDVLAENPLGEACFASPAASEGQLFLRGERHLFAVGARESSQAAARSND